ncbi:Small G protein signaling modulator 1 [Fasciola gigantica]|uniref:Small G protein signaling modulator 1 n=1 Tax=Fasciola gigantica TaxID=46835 RepID=A0A504ZEN4_FASGI|nr:Small G protein signaling modulator 1 [Fasciola gigantica]
MFSAFFLNGNDDSRRKKILLNDIKTQVKKLMEEAVVRSYVHEENTVITTLCAAVEAILSHGLRQTVSTFFDDSTLALCRRVAKSCTPAQHVLDRMEYHRNAMQLTSKQPPRSQVPRELVLLSAPNGTLPRSGKISQNEFWDDKSTSGSGDRASSRSGGLARSVSLRSSTVPTASDLRLKNFWIRVALLEKVLDKIVYYLASNANRFYEKFAIMADPCDGMLVADLLRGPCAVDYSRTRTTDYLYTDPPVAELIQRHGISGSLRSRQLPYVPPSSQVSSDRDTRSISIQSLPSVQTSPDNAVLSVCNGSADCGYPTPLSQSTDSRLNSRTSSMISVPQVSDYGWTSEIESLGTTYSGPGSTRIARRKLVLAAKEHVESMHQSVGSTLLYGKNNVLMETIDGTRELPGYLSLHDYGSEMGLVLKWTPNGAMSPHSPSALLRPLDSELENTKVNNSPQDTERIGTKRDAYWRYAIRTKLSDLVYIHCHEWNDTHRIVFICKDGIQLPPMTFYAKSHLPVFLHCLEQSLENQGGFLDPKFHDIGEKASVSRIVQQDRQTCQPRTPNGSLSQMEPGMPFAKIVSGSETGTLSSRRPLAFDGSFLERILYGNVTRSTNEASVQPDAPNCSNKNSESVESTEHGFRTFRIVCADMPHGKGSGWNLLGRCATPQISNSDELNVDDGDGKEAGQSFEQSCKNIARNVLYEAFRQWLSYCQKLRVLRSRLAYAVTPRLLTVDSPTDASGGVDQNSWEQLRGSTDPEFTFFELCRRVYFGNCEPSLRRKVWPFLLGVYPWSANAEEVDRLEQLNERMYQTSLAEWLNAQYWIKDPDKIDSTSHLPATRNSSARSDRMSDGPSQSSDPLRVQHEKCDENQNATADSPSGLRKPVDPHDHLISDRVAFAESTSFRILAIPSFEATPDSHTPTAKLDDLETPSANQSSRFKFDRLLDSVQTNEHIPSRLKFSPDSGTSIDMESDGAVNFELSEEVPYSDEILDALGINLYRIDKDVSRCDRNHSFFANPKKNLTSDNLKEVHSESEFAELNNNLNKLRNVICTWVWVHLDAGYVQGMCDLLAPLLVVLEDESMTYACFCRLMEWMLPNFPVAKSTSTPSPTSNRLTEATFTGLSEPKKTSVRPTLLSLAKKFTEMSSPASPTPSNDSANLIDEGCSDVNRSLSARNSLPQTVYVPSVPSPYSAALTSSEISCMDLRFANLKALIEVFDPELFTFLTEKSLDSQFYFCYRWLLLDFKREFKYEDVFAIWEIIWASRRLVAYDFGVFFALALLQYYRDIILYYDMDLTEIIRFYNELTEQHDTRPLLDLARSLVFQMQNILHDS